MSVRPSHENWELRVFLASKMLSGEESEEVSFPLGSLGHLPCSFVIVDTRVPPRRPRQAHGYPSLAVRESVFKFLMILSVLAITYSDTQPRGTLYYPLLSAFLRLTGSPLADSGTWGHEYVRHLASELGDEYAFREQGKEPTAPGAGKGTKDIGLPGTIEDQRALAMECTVFFIGRNTEPDAVDLLGEPEVVHEII
ncbi:hypothetical protein B0H11DRAFT_2346914 [Mycena galericulata]|nr:hypothetical protein B0H11DRAFT_2346914 [Mycena galericulata]